MSKERAEYTSPIDQFLHQSVCTRTTNFVEGEAVRTYDQFEGEQCVKELCAGEEMALIMPGACHCGPFSMLEPSVSVAEESCQLCVGEGAYNYDQW